MKESYRGIVIGVAILLSSVFVGWLILIFDQYQPVAEVKVPIKKPLAIGGVKNIGHSFSEIKTETETEDEDIDFFEGVELVQFHSNFGYSIEYPYGWELFSEYIYDSTIPENFISVFLRPSDYSGTDIHFGIFPTDCNKNVGISNGEITVLKDISFLEEFSLSCLSLYDYVKALREINLDSDEKNRGKEVSQISEVEIGGLKGYRFDLNTSFETGTGGHTLPRSELTSFYFFQLNKQKFKIQFRTKDKLAERVLKTLTFDTDILESSKIPSEEIVEDETEPNKPILDLTKLQGKDRLYTEEEGKYENLNEEEKKVLIEVYYCRNFKGKGKQVCKQYAEINKVKVEGARLMALKDEMAVVYRPDGAEMEGWLYIYDLSKQVLVANTNDQGDIAFGPNYIIMTKRSVQDSQILQLYRPGMSDFIDIPDSQSQEEYVDRSDQFNRIFPIEFGINSITTYLHTFKNCVDIGGDFAPGFYECKIDTKVPKTFDLSNLP